MCIYIYIYIHMYFFTDRTCRHTVLLKKCSYATVPKTSPTHHQNISQAISQKHRNIIISVLSHHKHITQHTHSSNKHTTYDMKMKGFIRILAGWAFGVYGRFGVPWPSSWKVAQNDLKRQMRSDYKEFIQSRSSS